MDFVSLLLCAGYLIVFIGTFINLFKDKVNYSCDTLSNVFIYLVKTDREFDKNELHKDDVLKNVLKDEQSKSDNLSEEMKIVQTLFKKDVKEKGKKDKNFGFFLYTNPVGYGRMDKVN